MVMTAFGWAQINTAKKGDEMKVSLIITTYNWPEALSLVLSSVKGHNSDSFDLVIADDGSDSATAEIVKTKLKNCSFAWCHVRHAHDGIRQARIKNLAVRYALGDYFIFIDHDVVLHPDFVKDHVANCRQDCFLQGKRVFLSEKESELVLKKLNFTPPSPFRRGIENRKNAFHFPKAAGRLAKPKQFQVTLRGCNLSMSKSAFMAVDGYDEIFDGLWGREDSDICYRMFNSGIKVRNLWFAAIQYHLHHQPIKRTQKDRLDEELDIILKEKRCRAMKGFSSLSTQGQVVAGNH